MLHYFVLYKPYEVLSQFSKEGDKKTLKDICVVPGDVYPVGRLDYDSEGLLLLTNDRTMNAALLHPDKAHSRSYLVQVEGKITNQAVLQLQNGVEISVNGAKYLTKPAQVQLLKDDPLSSAHYAISAAVTTIEQDAVVRRTLNDEEIRNKMKDMEIKETEI